MSARDRVLVERDTLEPIVPSAAPEIRAEAERVVLAALKDGPATLWAIQLVCRRAAGLDFAGTRRALARLARAGTVVARTRPDGKRLWGRS